MLLLRRRAGRARPPGWPTCRELRGNEVLARRAWVGGAGRASAVSPALLISDLGRPERFLNMLRMFKVTSPMSVGSWILSGERRTHCAGGDRRVDRACSRAPEGRPARLRPLFGLPLSTYTAALLANTAVPVWHEARTAAVRVRLGGRALRGGGRGDRHASRSRSASAPARTGRRGARSRSQPGDDEAGSASTESPTAKARRRASAGSARLRSPPGRPCWRAVAGESRGRDRPAGR